MNILKKILAVSSIGVLLGTNILPCFAYTSNNFKENNKNYYNENLNYIDSAKYHSDTKEIENEDSNYSEEYKEYLNLSDEEKESVEVIPRKYEVPFDDFLNNLNEEKNESVFNEKNNDNIQIENNRNSNIIQYPANNIVQNSSVIPEEYNLSNDIDITVENQGSYGLCWDFASVKSLETYLSLNGYGNLDFSELHVDYLTSSDFGGWRALHDGGNFEVFEQYLSKTNGPVYEEEVPYNANYNKENYDYLLSLDNKAYVYETVNLPSIYKYIDENDNLIYSKTYLYKNLDNELVYTNDNVISSDELEAYRNYVKNHIIQNGGLYSIIATPDPGKNYLNLSNNSEYYSGNSSDLSIGREIHAVTIVGWDDNYSKENFNEGRRPKNDGAYIVLNSWGESYGNQGYYYVSYDDFYIESQLSGIKNASTQFSKDDLITISIEDINLYNGLKDQLGRYKIYFDDENLEIGLTKLVLEDITSLNLSDKGISNISGLEKFEYLRMLDLSQNEIENIDSLKKENTFNYLWLLDLSQNQIQEIEFTDSNYLVNLDNLNLCQNEIVEIDLSGLHKLYYLRISDNNISDISFISDLEGLNILEAKNNDIEEFPGLNANDNNAVIDLSGNKHLDLSTINIEKVETLDLSNCDIDNDKINDLPSNENLKSLLLSNNHISSLDFLSKFKLQALDISYTDITDLSELEDNEYAESILSLNVSGINNIQGIERLPLLNALILDNCNSVDFTVISNLNNLMTLSLNNSNITTIEDLSDLSKLYNLSLDNNPNIDLSSIKDINSLESISLQNCEITDILDILSNTSLTSIYLNNNNIENINLLSEIEDRYIYIDFSNNKIKSIPNLGNSISIRLKNQNIEEDYELQLGKENYIEFPDIIDNAYNERFMNQITFECENCELDLNNRAIKVFSEREGTGQAKIKVVGGTLDGSYYTINYEMTNNIEKIGIETEYEGRTLYLEGENFDLEKLKVYLLYDNGLMEEITNFEIEDNTDLEAGQENVKVFYEDFESNIEIFVYSKNDAKKIKFNDQGIYNSFILSTYDYESGLINNDNNKHEIIITNELCDSVTDLYINDKVSDLTGISEFTNLNSLELNNYNSKDMTEIAKLHNLKMLKIDNKDNEDSQIEDISLLNNLSNLEKLILWNTKVKDINNIYSNLELDYINISSDYELNELENEENIVYLPEYFGELLEKCENPSVVVTFNCNLLQFEVKTDENQRHYIELDKNEYENYTDNIREAYISLLDLNKGISVSIVISYSMNDNLDNPDNPDNPDINYGYQIEDSLIVDVNAKTDVNVFKEKFAGDNNIEIIILDKDGNELSEDTIFVGTGMQIRLKNENGEFILDEKNNPITYIVTVKGDIDGDGVAGDIDAIYLKAYRNEIQGSELNEAQIEAIDINSDGTVNYTDSNLLKLHRMEVEGYDLNNKV